MDPERVASKRLMQFLAKPLTHVLLERAAVFPETRRRYPFRTHSLWTVGYWLYGGFGSIVLHVASDSRSILSVGSARRWQS